MSIWGWVKSTNPAVNKPAAKSNTTQFIGSHKHLNNVFRVLHSFLQTLSKRIPVHRQTEHALLDGKNWEQYGEIACLFFFCFFAFEVSDKNRCAYVFQMVINSAGGWEVQAEDRCRLIGLELCMEVTSVPAVCSRSV